MKFFRPQVEELEPLIPPSLVTYNVIEATNQYTITSDIAVTQDMTTNAALVTSALSVTTGVNEIVASNTNGLPSYVNNQYDIAGQAVRAQQAAVTTLDQAVSTRLNLWNETQTILARTNAAIADINSNGWIPGNVKAVGYAFQLIQDSERLTEIKACIGDLNTRFPNMPAFVPPP